MEGLWDESQGSVAFGDLVLLQDLSNPGIEDALKSRFDTDRIYTYIGPVLISINPFKSIQNIYNIDTINKYKHKYQQDAPPHIFALAEAAYRNSTNAPQCVVICGESGAGKTEASKKIMQYIAAVSGSGEKIEKVKDQLLKSNPILEAFGNAKTLRNNNSSRFGKYFEMFFDFKGNPTGGRVQDYLLEKSRIVQTGKGERSFHIFYQLLKGASEDEKERFKLKPIESYNYLKSGDVYSSDEAVDRSVVFKDPDLADFKEVKDAILSLEITESERDSIFRVLSAILWIGEIGFEGSGDSSKVAENKEALENVAQLLEIKKELLLKCFIQRESKMGGDSRGDIMKEAVIRTHKLSEAKYARDAFAKTIYARLFDWIVQKINKTITPFNKSYNSIGVLDIYGFEIFKTNSFEQFCINYVNEKLQYVFIERTLKTEQEEYQQENIEWTHIEYFNNKIVCELIEGKRGIIALLNEVCLTPKGTDDYFFDILKDNLFVHPHMIKQHAIKGKVCFAIKHYAGDVEYATATFVDKNKDYVWKDLLQVGHSSDLQILKEIFAEDEIQQLGQKRPVTAATQFKEQVNQLMEAIAKCHPLYVRCIKPNDSKRSSFWESERVLHQIQYLGLLQNVLVRRAGFAFRDTFVRFMNRYKMLCAQTWPSWDIKKADKACLLIMEELKFSADKFQMGKTKIFIKDPMTMKVLESKRSVRVAQLMILISAHAKACAPRLFFQDFKAARLLQTRWRGFMARRNFLQFKAAELLQSVMKGTMFRVDKQKFMSCTYIQRSFRFYLTRKWPIQTRITLSEMLTPKKSRRRISTDLYPIRFYIPELVSSGAIEDLFKATGDSRVLFVEHAVKYGTKFKTRDRVLIVSNLAVFDVEYFPKKRKEKMLVLHHRFSLHSISQLSLLPLHDNFVGVHMSTLYDLAYCLDHKSEFVSVVCEQYSSVVKRDLSVVVCKEISLRMRDDKIRVLVSGSVEEKCDRVCGLRVDKHNSDRGIVLFLFLLFLCWASADKRHSLHDLFAEDAIGRPLPLVQFVGQWLLVVNVASQCGYTDSGYRALVSLHESYPRLTVLAFPSNQFGQQEPQSATQVEQWAKHRFGAHFPILNKVLVNGPDAHPVFKFLKQDFPGDVSWNFHGIWLVDPSGHPVRRYDTPDWTHIENDIRKYTTD